jgi:hypothetical protein
LKMLADLLEIPDENGPPPQPTRSIYPPPGCRAAQARPLSLALIARETAIQRCGRPVTARCAGAFRSDTTPRSARQTCEPSLHHPTCTCRANGRSSCAQCTTAASDTAGALAASRRPRVDRLTRTRPLGPPRAKGAHALCPPKPVPPPRATRAPTRARAHTVSLLPNPVMYVPPKQWRHGSRARSVRVGTCPPMPIDAAAACLPLPVCRCTRAAVRSAPRTVALIRSAAEPPQIADAIAARSHDVAVTQPPVHPPPPLLHHQQAPGMAAHPPADSATPAAHPPSVTATPAAHPPSVTAAAAMASPAVESGRKGSVFSRAKEQASSLFGRQGTVRERMPLKRLVANCCACRWLARGWTAVHEMAWYPVRWYPIPHSIQCDTVAPSYIRCRMSTAEELVGRPTHCNAPLALIDRPADSTHEHQCSAHSCEHWSDCT